jgi:hypothetical protein
MRRPRVRAQAPAAVRPIAADDAPPPLSFPRPAKKPFRQKQKRPYGRGGTPPPAA